MARPLCGDALRALGHLLQGDGGRVGGRTAMGLMVMCIVVTYFLCLCVCDCVFLFVGQSDGDV